MAADIMKATNVALAVHHEEEGEACDFILDIVAGLLEAIFMGNKEPVLGEDGTPLDLVYSGRAVPARRECRVLGSGCVTRWSRHDVVGFDELGGKRRIDQVH